jgi:hypothetical protein
MQDSLEQYKNTSRFSTTGKIIYSDSGWVVLHAHHSIQDFYHAFLEWNLKIHFNKPMHGCHITVVSGKYEQCQTHPLWMKHHKEVIDFEYGRELKTADTSWWLEVYSPKLTEIRNELGLTDTPFWPFHITVANRKNLT